MKTHPNLQQYLISHDQLNQHMASRQCILCQKSYSALQMFSVTHMPQCGHRFCRKCLLDRLDVAIAMNQDLFCPIDSCPYPLSEQSSFFANLPFDNLKRYEGWKSSDKYKYRNSRFSYQSFTPTYEGKVQPHEIRHDAQEKMNKPKYQNANPVIPAYQVRRANQNVRANGRAQQNHRNGGNNCRACLAVFTFTYRSSIAD